MPVDNGLITILNKPDLLLDNPYIGSVPKYKAIAIAEQGFRILICGNYLCFYKISDIIVEAYHIVGERRDYSNLILNKNNVTKNGYIIFITR